MASVHSPSMPAPISHLLSGDKAFYKQPDYVETTRKDFSRPEALPPSYTWDTQPKIIRIAKEILSFLVFPVKLYELLHALIGKIALLPASNPKVMGIPESYPHAARMSTELNGEWKYKRLTIEVDGYKIDAVIIGKPSTLSNGRWILSSNGNGEFYENKLTQSRDFKQILSTLHSNAIVFNYPGVGSSSGLPNRGAMTKAYRAMLSFLEDRTKGIGAKEIIGYGHSIGGAVQGEALLSHTLKEDVRYVFVKSRTFADVSSVAEQILGSKMASLARLAGWNLSCLESSKKLTAPEIILQTAKVDHAQEISDSSPLIYDEVIPAESSLAKALLEDPDCPKRDKTFLGIPEGHNDSLVDTGLLVRKIEEGLTR